MSRYVIMARENYPGANIREVCRCNSYPKAIRNALADYTVTGSLGTRIHKYNHVEILNLSRQKTGAQMKQPKRNMKRLSDDALVANLISVFRQIDTMRAEHGEQAEAGQASQERTSLQIGQPESSKP